MRAANSSARSPANTRCVWLSTKPGTTQRPAGVDPLVGGRAGRRHGHDPSVLDHDRGVANEPERAVAEAGIVGDEQADAVDDERGHAAAPHGVDGLGERGRDRDRHVLAVADDPAPADHHVARRRAPRPRTPPPRRGGRARRRPGGRCRGRRRSRSASAPTPRRPASGQPSERRAARRGRGQEVGGGVVAADAGGQPLVELHRPGLLEQVDHRVRVATRGTAARRPRRARPTGPMPSARSRSVVGQKQTRAAPPSSRRRRRR